MTPRLPKLTQRTRDDLYALIKGETTLYRIAKKRRLANPANDGVRLLRGVQAILADDPTLRAAFIKKL
jgi:hypothetical protein